MKKLFFGILLGVFLTASSNALAGEDYFKMYKTYKARYQNYKTKYEKEKQRRKQVESDWGYKYESLYIDYVQCQRGGLNPWEEAQSAKGL